jgi:hypothetical protein
MRYAGRDRVAPKHGQAIKQYISITLQDMDMDMDITVQ